MGISYGLYSYGHPENTHFQNALSGINSAISGLGLGILGWLAARPKVQAADRQVVAGTVATARTTSGFMKTFYYVIRAASFTSEVASDLTTTSSSSSVGADAVGGGVFFDPATGASTGVNTGISGPIGGGQFVDTEAGPGGRKRGLEDPLQERQGKTCLTIADIASAFEGVNSQSYPSLGWNPYSEVEQSIAGAANDQCY